MTKICILYYYIYILEWLKTSRNLKGLGVSANKVQVEVA
jgi:hypothetical protein